MINGRTRLPIINEHTNEVCYTLNWSKNTIKFELIETIESSSRYVIGIIIYNKIDVSSMKSQIMMAIGVAIVASVLVTGLASSIYAQSNMTGGNMTGGNMTGGNMTMPSATDTTSGDGSGDDDGEDEDNEGENEEDEGNN
jgi:glucose uptake protein GlcU